MICHSLSNRSPHRNNMCYVSPRTPTTCLPLSTLVYNGSSPITSTWYMCLLWDLTYYREDGIWMGWSWINIRNRIGDDEGGYDDFTYTEFELLSIYPIGNIHQSHENVRLVFGSETEPKYECGRNSRACDRSIAQQMPSPGERVYIGSSKEQRISMGRQWLDESEEALGKPSGSPGREEVEPPNHITSPRLLRQLYEINDNDLV